MRQIAHGGDPFEMGSARPLDYGHWSAHKLEQISNYAWRHGEAVALGGEDLEAVLERAAHLVQRPGQVGEDQLGSGIHPAGLRPQPCRELARTRRDELHRALTALGVNLLGDWLRDTLDPKLRV